MGRGDGGGERLGGGDGGRGGWEGQEDSVSLGADVLAAWGETVLGGPASGEGEGGNDLLGGDGRGGIRFGGEGDSQDKNNEETEAQSVVLGESSAETSGGHGDESHDWGEGRSESIRNGGLWGGLWWVRGALWWVGGWLGGNWDNVGERDLYFNAVIVDDNRVVSLPSVDFDVEERRVGEGGISLDKESIGDLLVNRVEGNLSDDGTQVELGRGHSEEEEESAEDWENTGHSD